MNSLNWSKARKSVGLIFLFLCTAIFFRFWTFFQSGLDWDESLYMLVSQSILDGKIPYVEVWDNKPVGIYLIYVVAFLLFGKSVFAIRLMSCIAIAVTGYILYCFGRLIGKRGHLTGLFAALIYTVAALQNDGRSANTEIFFIPFVVAAYYLTCVQWLQPNKAVKPLQLFLSGLLLGMAFIIKYIVIYDLAAVLLFLLLLDYKKTTGSLSLKTIRNVLVLLSGFLLPFLVMAGFFLLNHHFSDFVYANFTANKIRNLDRSFSGAVVVEALQSHLRLNVLLWFCLAVAVLISFLTRTLLLERRILSFLLAWLFIPLLGIFLTFKVRFYGHYFLPLLPPLSLIASLVIVTIALKIGVFKPFQLEQRVGSDNKPDNDSLTQLASPDSFFMHRFHEDAKPHLSWLVLLLSGILFVGLYGVDDLKANVKFFYFRCVKMQSHYKDKSAEIAEYIQLHNQQNDYIYVADYDPVIYFLSHSRIPTKYAYPFFLMGDNLPKVAGVNLTQEFSALVAKKPVYIVVSTVSKETKNNHLFYAKLRAWLEQDYTLDQSDSEVKLYRRNSR